MAQKYNYLRKIFEGRTVFSSGTCVEADFVQENLLLMIYVMKSAFKDRLGVSSLEVATKVLSSLGLNDAWQVLSLFGEEYVNK